MAKPLVTQELVFEAANALTAEGDDPTIKTVQARIGGGSYTTVKKFLDLWQQERTTKAQAAPPTPPELEAKGNDFIRQLWIMASAQAEATVTAAKEAAAAEVTAMKEELSEARNEITRLEGIEQDLTSRSQMAEQQLREAELQLAAARTEAGRLRELETANTNLQHELNTTRKDAKTQAMAAAEKTGEINALKTQLQELMQTLRAKPAARRKKEEGSGGTEP
jgi:DNA repair exonuclease SbcCD ATPase subunit